MFYFYPIRSKGPPIFNFPTLDSAKYFNNYGEMGLNGPKFSKQELDEKIGLCERQHFHHTQKNLK